MAIKKLSKFWKRFFCLVVVLFAVSFFYSSTKFIGLHEYYECLTHGFRMERESNPWEKFWGARALELWKSFPLGHEGLAIALVKGKTLFGQKKLILIKKMGLPDGDKVESFYWSYRLSGINSSNEYHLQIIFDKEDMVSETVIEN